MTTVPLHTPSDVRRDLPRFESAPGSRRILRWAAMFAAAVALAIAAGVIVDRSETAPPPLDPATLAVGFGPADYPSALARTESDVASARAHWERSPSEWLRGEALARALIARHRLSGKAEDLAEADRLIDAGLAMAPDPAGPALTRAGLSLTLHRLPQAEAALARVARWSAPEREERADALALSGDIAQQRGDLVAAERAYKEAMRFAPSTGIALRRAVLRARIGEVEQASRDTDLLLAAPRQSPRALAELALQRAQLAYREGDWETAGEWIDAANRLFPGSWLSEAFAAQQLALAGNRREAERRYRAIAERTGNPAVMDALAQLLRLEGRRSESLAWWSRAEALWQARLERFPEEAALHAAEHALVGGRPQEALALAQAEAERRPHDATLSLLARAHLATGRPDLALAALDRAEAQGWRSAGLLMLRAEASAASGDDRASADARARAEAINPRAADPAIRLIWFGHD